MGYYDKFLTRLFETCTNRTVLLALAFKEQIVDEDDLPLDDHDRKVDEVVTSD
jgi:5-formyltetrahydrofolate cyclo-ligase